MSYWFVLKTFAKSVNYFLINLKDAKFLLYLQAVRSAGFFTMKSYIDLLTVNTENFILYILIDEESLNSFRAKRPQELLLANFQIT